MRPLTAVALSFLLPLSLGTASPPRGGGMANGLPNIAGTWVGKAKLKAYDLSGKSSTGFETGVCTLQLDVTQDGKDLFMQLSATCGDDPVPSVLNLQGGVGNYHLWAEQVTVSGEGVVPDRLFLSASVRTNETAMKGVGLVVSDNGASVTDFKFNLRRSMPK